MILGIGNPLLRDDGVGVRVAEAVGRHAPAEVVTGPLAGLALLDALEGYGRAVLIDATHGGADPPGTLRRVPLDELDGPAESAGSHALGVAQTLAWARRAGRPLPARIAVYTVAATELTTVGDELSPAVGAAVPRLVRRVLDEQFGIALDDELTEDPA